MNAERALSELAVHTYGHSGGRSLEDLVLEHAALVKRIAYHLIARLPPTVDVEDLIQAGMIGLLEAAGNFSTTGGANFSTFAGIRIRGAMLDEVRKLDWTPRSVHRRMREMSRAIAQIEHREGRDARDHEIAAALGLSGEDYHALLQDAASARLSSLDDLNEEQHAVVDRENAIEDEPLANLQDEGFRDQLAREIARLPEREQLVMSLYYDDELNLREIGEVLGVTESRVCQIHGQALARLRSRLHDWTQS
jgi:RNA polymerase sigma factor for flagellar operon FliA